MSESSGPPSSRHSEVLPTSMKAPQAPRYDFHGVIQRYLDEAARVTGVPEHVTSILRQPKNEIIVHFPVRLDSGEWRLFKGYRVQHSNILGPYKGGMRYHEEIGLDDCKALAAMM